VQLVEVLEAWNLPVEQDVHTLAPATE